MNRFQQFRKAFGIAVPGIVALIGSAVAPRAAVADTYRPVKLMISDRPGEHIGALSWDSYNLPVRVETHGDSREAFVDLHGTLQGTDTNLVFGQKQVPLTPAQGGTASTFSLTIPLQGEVSIFNFYAVDPYGRTQKEKIALVFPDWHRFKLPLTRLTNYRRFLMSTGLGVSELHYQEAGVIDMNELGLTGKFNATYRLDPDTWEVGGNVFLTLLPLPLSIPSGESAARWYGINGRVAYHLPMDSLVSNTHFWLMTGWYIWGMIVNSTAQNSYGVAYLGGPQIFINARITPPGRQGGYVYLKYAPISSGLQIFSTTNREIAIGGGKELSHPGAHHPLYGTLDIADAKFSDVTNSLHLFSLSLGVSVGL